MSIIETDALTRRFGDLTAVDCVSLQVSSREIFGLIGPNGAGKSTLIKMLTTLLPPSSGTARIAGFDVVSHPAQVRAHIGYVPQLLSADGALTAYENLLLSARLYLIPRKEREMRINAALKLMDMESAAHRQVQGFSGGMIRRLEIAQSMMHEPVVMFMDEPTVGLDPVARRAVWDHVRQIREELGTTILITTHLMDEADELCDRIGVLHAGRLQEVGTPQELKARIGPDATLDDVFAEITGTEIVSGGSYRDVRQTRASARAHS
ncbi:ABC transporter ATP-binding protein [Microvirga alba]|uniref:ATP-binding cassette domain-containing protein n=1 Tax=Microvirga alba TaxID=2791025 RepID=A0A931BTM8_9HYPH|nr:ATP-binding cassette domain-containing protein [Microvirga alba]MBF9235753.1 ATP-binding cassette domain-containing protein [Microvirga alba]